MARSRSNLRDLARLLSDSPFPIYALNEQRRIVYCNSACQEWAGLAVKELVGKFCHYHSSRQPADPNASVAGLCPPPEAFYGDLLQGIVACHDVQGDLLRRRAHFLPLAKEALESPGVIVVVEAESLKETAANDLLTHEPSPAEVHEQVREFRRHQAGRYRLDRFLGEHPLLRRVRDQIVLAYRGQSHVLITGPPGSGREHVARSIHAGDDVESAGPLVPLACMLMDAELIQGTITAFVRRCEENETDRCGALLLLEVDQLSHDAQAELAGFLRLPNFQLHILATTRVPLLPLAAGNDFRFDLACALSTLVVELPALADCREDIPLLAQAFLEEQNAVGGRQLGGFTPEALDRLVSAPWTGNFDELIDIVRQAHQCAEGPLVTLEDLPTSIHLAAEAEAFARPEEERIILDEFLAKIEAELITRALRQTKGNKAKAARLLGMTRARLHRRISLLHLES